MSRHHYDLNKVSQAFISQDLSANSSAITIETNSTITYNQIQSTKFDTFSLDKITGFLKLKKQGNYTLTFNSVVRNSGTSQSLFGVCALQNGSLISNSQAFTTVSQHQIQNFTKTFSFDALEGDEICLMYSYPNSQFQIPAAAWIARS